MRLIAGSRDTSGLPGGTPFEVRVRPSKKGFSCEGRQDSNSISITTDVATITANPDHKLPEVRASKESTCHYLDNRLRDQEGGWLAGRLSPQETLSGQGRLQPIVLVPSPK